MTKYIIQRIIWIFIILFTTMTITFVLLKLAPEYPPTKNDEKDTWLEKQVADGFYTSEYYDATDPDELAIVDEIRQTNENINQTVFIVNPYSDGDVIKVFYRVPIIEQYFQWVENVLTDWDWGLSTKVKVNVPAFQIISDRIPLTLSFLVIS